MGVYINGMEMPQDNCYGYRRIVISNSWQDGRMRMFAHDDITLEFIGEVVEVPEPHGRLIDADALMDAVYRHLCIKGEENLLPAEKSVFGNIIKAPTIIERSE